MDFEDSSKDFRERKCEVRVDFNRILDSEMRDGSFYSKKERLQVSLGARSCQHFSKSVVHRRNAAKNGGSRVVITLSTRPFPSEQEFPTVRDRLDRRAFGTTTVVDSSSRGTGKQCSRSDLLFIFVDTVYANRQIVNCERRSS